MQDLSVWMVLYAGEEFRSVAPGDMIRPERADRELRHAPDREILRNAAIKLGVSRFRTAGLEILQLIVDLKFPQPRFERMTCDFSLHPSFPRT